MTELTDLNCCPAQSATVCLHCLEDAVRNRQASTAATAAANRIQGLRSLSAYVPSCWKSEALERFFPLGNIFSPDKGEVAHHNVLQQIGKREEVTLT